MGTITKLTHDILGNPIQIGYMVYTAHYGSIFRAGVVGISDNSVGLSVVCGGNKMFDTIPNIRCNILSVYEPDATSEEPLDIGISILYRQDLRRYEFAIEKTTDITSRNGNCYYDPRRSVDIPDNAKGVILFESQFPQEQRVLWELSQN